MKAESNAECNTFDLHLAIIGLKNHFFRVAVFLSIMCGPCKGIRVAGAICMQTPGDAMI